MDLMLLDMSRRFLPTRYDTENGTRLIHECKDAVGGVAAILSGFIRDHEYLETQLMDWLTSTSAPNAAQTLEARRAMILALSTKEGKLSVRNRYSLARLLT